MVSFKKGPLCNIRNEQRARDKCPSIARFNIDNSLTIHAVGIEYIPNDLTSLNDTCWLYPRRLANFGNML